MKDIIIYAAAGYLVVINAVAFIMPPIDKYKAKKKRWRIKESTLLITAALGGSAAMYISMLIFRHKTKHIKFMAGIPIIFAVQLVTAFLIIGTGVLRQ